MKKNNKVQHFNKGKPETVQPTTPKMKKDKMKGKCTSSSVANPVA